MSRAKNLTKHGAVLRRNLLNSGRVPWGMNVPTSFLGAVLEPTLRFIVTTKTCLSVWERVYCLHALEARKGRICWPHESIDHLALIQHFGKETHRMQS